MLSYILWNVNPEMFSLGSFSFRWYGLLFALGFIISQQILYFIFVKEGKPRSDVDTITLYMVLATLIGARLGHVIFYQPEMLWTDPLGIFLPFEFTPRFRFIGLQGLASHGGAFAILFALWLYARKKKPGQNFFQSVDRIVIVVALTGALIRFGNFFNSEIIGKPTNARTGVVFVNRVVRAIMADSYNGIVESIEVEKAEGSQTYSGVPEKPIRFNLLFASGTTRDEADQYIRSSLQFYLTNMPTYVKIPDRHNMQYTFVESTNGNLMARVDALGIARHPAQLYESFSCFLLFWLLFWIWSIKKEKSIPGLIFGVFMVLLWGARFFYEFIKENQEPFEDSLPLNMGQFLSIPLFIAGVVLLVWVYRSYASRHVKDK